MRLLAWLRRIWWSENRLLWLVCLSWLPVLYFYWQSTTALTRLDTSIGLIVLVSVYGLLLWQLRRSLRRPLLTLSNLLLSMQEGDYGLRARQYHGVIGDVLQQTNSLAQTLKALRIGEREAHLLLSKMIAAIDLAVLIFDQRQRLTLANPEAERLLLGNETSLRGRTAEELGVASLMALDGEVAPHQFPGGVGRFRVRSFVFYQDTQEHRLLAMADVSKLLVEEERLNWQRLLRVLSHELNNSLVPIKNMAQTLESMTHEGADMHADYDEDLQQGLSLIARRADALHRFIQGYARLARLPPPATKEVDVGELIRQVARLENLTRVEVVSGPPLYVEADPDQLEQVLLNLLSNAMDATDNNQGDITVTWTQQGQFAQLSITDTGTGIANRDNLFVPFFTTKASGSGIGLVLCKQIVESHQGQITLQSSPGDVGAVATITLPLAPRSVPT